MTHRTNTIPMIRLPIMSGGRLRGDIDVPMDSDIETVKQAALTNEAVITFLNGRTPRNVIVVLGKMVNLIM